MNQYLYGDDVCALASTFLIIYVFFSIFYDVHTNTNIRMVNEEIISCVAMEIELAEALESILTSGSCASW